MTKRKREGNDALNLDSVNNYSNHTAVTSWQPTVEREASPPTAQPATEGKGSNGDDVATLAT